MQLFRVVLSVLAIILSLLVAGCGDSSVSDSIAPSTPANVSASSTSSSSVALTWDESIDNIAVAGYKIYRNGVFLNTVTSPTVTDSDLTTYTQYCYSIVAVDLFNNESVQSAPVCTNTNPKPAKVVISTGWPISSGTPPSVVNISSLEYSLAFPLGVNIGNTGPGGIFAAETLGGIWTTAKAVVRSIGPIHPPPPSAPSVISYMPGTATTPTILIYGKGSGSIGLGEFMTLYLEVEAGRTITSEDFVFTGFGARDSSSAIVPVAPSLVFSYL